MDRGAWWAIDLGVAESDMTDWLTFSLSLPITDLLYQVKQSSLMQIERLSGLPEWLPSTYA